MEVLEMVTNNPFYNIKMKNVITPGNMIIGSASKLSRSVTNNPEIKNLLGISLISTLSGIIKKSFI